MTIEPKASINSSSFEFLHNFLIPSKKYTDFIVAFFFKFLDQFIVFFRNSYGLLETVQFTDFVF